MRPAYPKPVRRRKLAPAAPTLTVRHEVIRRDANRCRWCGLWVDTSAGWYSLQHRRARGAGGTSRPESNYAANLVLVHGTGTTGCHGDIESKPAEAAARGFRLTQQQDPRHEPIILTGGKRLWLDDDGGFSAHAPAKAA